MLLLPGIKRCTGRVVMGCDFEPPAQKFESSILEKSWQFSPTIKTHFFLLFESVSMPQDPPQLSTKKYMTKLYIEVFLYQCANALLLPIMPYFTNSLNANVTEYGLVFTVYYVAQLISLFHSIGSFIGSLSFGGIGDKYGRRIAVCVPLIGIAICKSVCQNLSLLVTTCEVFCTNVRLLILWRVFTGLFDCLTAVSQASPTLCLRHF